jgi:hypothetical protein
MKTLEAFWHWVENEKPAAITTYAAREKTCTEVEMRAVDMALDAVYERTFRRWNDETWNEYAPALKALSLAFCEALERMHEQVPGPQAFTEAFLDAVYSDCPRCSTKHDTLSSMIDCEESEKAEARERGLALVRMTGVDLAEIGRWALGGYQDPPPDPCAKCGNPLHLHHPYPSEPGSCVPRIEGQSRPRHGDPRDLVPEARDTRFREEIPTESGVLVVTGCAHVPRNFNMALPAGVEYVCDLCEAAATRR